MLSGRALPNKEMSPQGVERCSLKEMSLFTDGMHEEILYMFILFFFTCILSQQGIMENWEQMSLCANVMISDDRTLKVSDTICPFITLGLNLLFLHL